MLSYQPAHFYDFREERKDKGDTDDIDALSEFTHEKPFCRMLQDGRRRLDILGDEMEAVGMHLGGNGEDILTVGTVAIVEVQIISSLVEGRIGK
jgi:hypothetical protein